VIFLPDTTVLIDVLRARRNRRASLAELVEAGHTLATGAINIAEIYAGMRPSEEQQTAGLLSSLDFYAINEPIARRAGHLKSLASQKGKTLSLADILVAATALEHNLILITDNRKDFPVPGLGFHPLA
jgi:tRNA(fMet)-specific endonuclease VapC